MPKGRKGRSATASLCALPSCSAPASEQVCCPQCQRARYCKRAHQIADVGRHKAVCVASSSGASVKTRTVDAIFFPANESFPRIVKVNCRVHRGGPAGNPEKHELDWSSYLSSDHEFVPHPIAPVERESSRHTHSSRLFLVFDHSAIFNANMPVNRCAMQLTGGNSAMLWRGDLLGYRVREPSEDHAQFMDASMDDLSAFTQFLKYHCTVPPMPSGGHWGSAHPEDAEDMASIFADMMFGEHLSDLEEELRASGFQPPPRRSRKQRYERRARDPSPSSSEWTETDASDERTLNREDIRQMMREEFRIQQDDLRALLRKEVADEVWVGLFQVAVLAVAAYFGWHWLLFPILRFFYGGGTLFMATVWKTLRWSLWFLF
ncbi:hypothetical protein K466DRAFT_246304 [Polyporus arcularius HHB13444]|uniref:MYND-type domain-containing protein n=1 Tax=Polyporus arcularius HHB13444 TaxID=1314778 RepID=A0A5C3PXV7_9APHY|nr:hypothetical protein K466DRAFT_246304 [Polyporus arcularius HHB13444]